MVRVRVGARVGKHQYLVGWGQVGVRLRVRVRARVQDAGHAVEKEAEAFGQVAQVGSLPVEEEEEQQPLELRVAQPGVRFL